MHVIVKAKTASFKVYLL